MGDYDDLVLDKDAARTLADGLGTAGQEIQTVGKGGALADGVLDGLPGADAPAACQLAVKSADKAMGAVGTALLEMGGTAVAAIIAMKAKDEANAKAVAAAGEGIK
ncbi:hypothetical protein [Nocardia sp. XZ_19_385]|uniref:hypothetical protein n=1 Tax=Nocardia sp. XZ_19_385 TaxID=2769488 RepID=UPI00188DFDF8|nr:hypothetical protein [Nocardia sp. XZ_19_385]